MVVHRLPVLLAAAALTTCGLAAGAAPAAAASGYTVRSLGAIGIPVGISAAGAVVGSSDEDSSTGQYTNTLDPAPYDHPIALSGGSTDSGFATFASGISGRGRAVGGYQDTGSNNLGVTWSRTGQPTDVGGYRGLAPGDNPDVTLADINDSGQLVGTADRPGHGVVATRWSATHVASPIDPSGSNVTVHAINDNAVVAGSVGGFAALFLPGGTVRMLGRTAGETASTAVALNDSDEVVGSMTRAGKTSPVYWDSGGTLHGVTVPAGTTSAELTGVNSSGEFSGGAIYPKRGVAVVWTSPSHPIVLPDIKPDPGTSIYGAEATAINDAGTVTGFDGIDGGLFFVQDAVVWTSPYPG